MGDFYTNTVYEATSKTRDFAKSLEIYSDKVKKAVLCVLIEMVAVDMGVHPSDLSTVINRMVHEENK